jgi:hypothetical protein
MLSNTIWALMGMDALLVLVRLGNMKPVDPGDTEGVNRLFEPVVGIAIEGISLEVLIQCFFTR